MDYRLEAAHQAMMRTLNSVADRCDGVRCDMAMLLLPDVFAKTWRDFPPAEGPLAENTDFWGKAIRETRRGHPDFKFVAEVYWGLEPRLQDLGFDYTYDKELYDKLMARDGAAIQRHLLEMPAERLAAGLHFLENHDERPVASVLSLAEHQASAMLILGLPGMRFIHEGQMEGARLRIPVQLVRRPIEPQQPLVAKMYRRLLSVLERSAVGRGSAELLPPSPRVNGSCPQVILIRWQASPEIIDLVAVNLATTSCQCYAPLRPREFRGEQSWSVTDLLGGAEWTLSGAELGAPGLPVDLAAYGVALYHCRPGPRPNP